MASNWRQFLDRPQNVWLRRLLFHVHLWVGVGVALYILLIGVTGSALVFRDEIEHAMETPPISSAEAAGPLADLDTVAARIRKAYPDRELASLLTPFPPNHPTIRGYLRKDQTYTAVNVHPVSGALLGAVPEGGFLHWLQDLHFNLLTGRTGRIVNGAGALCLLLMSLTGIVIWWPGLRNWCRSLTVDFSRQWKRINWDLHSAAGFWTLALLLTWAVSGAYFAWPTEFRTLVNWFSPVSAAQATPPDTSQKGKLPPPALRGLLAEATRRTHGGSLLSVSFPADDRGHIRVFMARGPERTYDLADYHYFDPFTGKHLAVWRRGMDQSAGDVVMDWIGPLHFGTFGGEGAAGIAVKVLWMLLGLAPPTLAVSGLLMYWNRYLSKVMAGENRQSSPRMRKTPSWSAKS
jgi:uncharacterized iron-regulated membrane protein